METNATFLDLELSTQAFELVDGSEAISKLTSCRSFLLGVDAVSEPSSTSLQSLTAFPLSLSMGRHASKLD